MACTVQEEGSVTRTVLACTTLAVWFVTYNTALYPVSVARKVQANVISTGDSVASTVLAEKSAACTVLAEESLVCTVLAEESLVCTVLAEESVASTASLYRRPCHH